MKFSSFTALLGLRLPWVAPLLVATLHPPFAACFMTLTGHADEAAAVLAWQLVAWPLLAGLALVTLGPCLMLLPASTPRSRAFALGSLLAGLGASAGSSALWMQAPEGVAPAVILVWALDLLAAACFQVAGRSLSRLRQAA